ncbi:AraC family transcriptional regulator [Pseudonocardia sp. GCM10023141]|uniref:AraC family transcriptional regulator n=1 Tax=Pseudonocardia sp. GCM10023141 TaxID=3252653 RepID=UPI00360A92D7
MSRAERHLAIPVLQASDVEGARAHIASVFIPHGLLPHDGGALGFRLAHFRTPRLTFGHATYGADMELLCPAMETSYHVNLTLKGTTRVQQGAAEAQTTARRTGAAFNANEPYRVRWSPDAVQLALKLPCRAVDEQLAALLGAPMPPVRLDLTFDLADPAGRGLLSAVHHLKQQFSLAADTGSVPRPIIAQLESYVLTQTLLAIPNNHSDALRVEPAQVGRSYVRRAAELVEQRADEPWTVEDLAREVSVGARALQSGFRRELGVTPMQYLREIRLRRARDELLNGSDQRVSEIAVKWGFYHLGRFSQQYRQRFGVHPSETLRRSSS